MNILLDTSFLLPFIHVEPDNISSTDLKTILNQQEHAFSYCELSIFELVAKGMRFCLNSDLTIGEIHQGIDSIIYRSPLKSVNWVTHPDLLELALKIRKLHKDTFDCLIFTTALYYCECFATADNTLFENILQDENTTKNILEINPTFHIWFDNLKHPPKLLTEVLKKKK